MGKRKMNQKSMDAIRKHGFRPGHDPRRNTAGRRPAPLTAALRARAEELTPDGKTTFAKAAAEAVFDAALEGSVSAFEAVADRLEGKPQQNIAQRVDMSIDRTLPPLSDEEYERGLGTRGYCNEWWARLTNAQMVQEMEKMTEILKRHQEKPNHHPRCDCSDCAAFHDKVAARVARAEKLQ